MKKNISIDYDELLTFVPYKYPNFLVEKVIKFKKNKYIKSLKSVCRDDFFLSGHFFKNPIYPGVLIVEFLAQSAIILLYKSDKKNYKKTFYLAKINFAKFLSTVKPENIMIGKIYIVKNILNSYVFYCKVFVKSKIVCITSFICIKK
ncbi:3-hydroxyacyl-ACP dehydratase FabZ family protein [Buchnera aphidicola (Ceratoglyphina bambusae)]|uniref:3-hydroxyacyl-ACP dehydratase FabZ family protein n=1 Tax=Buchnera aphidicola TaxID=9 RepID=UPI0031B86D85